MTFSNIHMGPQMLPRATKNAKWKEKMIDRMCSIADSQLQNNAKMLRDYQMVRGVFIPEYYMDSEGIPDMITALTAEFKMPSYIRHFDIIASTINTLSGEWQEHPDNYFVRRIDEFATNEYLRTKKDLLEQFISEQIQLELNKRLINKGIDPTGESIPEADREMYLQELEKQKEALTPPEIEKYMRMSYSDFGEIWANNKLKRSRERFNYKMMERVEIEDVFTASKCFRHHYLTRSGHNEETWNPVNTFYLISPDEHRAEKAEIIGRKFYATISDVIGRYGHRLSKAQLEELDSLDDMGSSASFLDTKNAYGLEYGAIIPFLDYPEHKMAVDNLGFNPGVELSDSQFQMLFNNKIQPSDMKGMFEIVEGYFRSKEKIGLLTYISPETGLKISEQVSEDFIVPKFIKVVNKAPNTVTEVNTICWTYQDRICEGVRIKGKGLKDSIYLGGDPCEFEFSEPENPFELLMPVCGLLSNFRNADGASIVNLMTSDQIGHNVVMNQGMQLLQRELGRFLVMDPRMIPNMKDWAGEQGWEKFTEVAKSLGITFADTSPEKLKGANSGNQFPRMIDMDESQRIMSRFRLAEVFENMAKKRIGMSEQRSGDIGSSETAEGIKQSISKSYNQTRSYYTDFSDFVKRCKRFSLDINQYVDSKKDSFKLNLGIGEEEKIFIDLNGNQIKWAQFDLYISDNQEDLRKLTLMRNLFMNNPNATSEPLDIFMAIEACSPAQLKQQLIKSKQDRDNQQQQQQQIAQEQNEIAKQKMQEDTLWRKEEHYSTLESKEKIAYMQTFSRQDSNMGDSNGDSIADILQFEKLNTDKTNKQELIAIQKQRLELDKQKADNDMKKHKDNVSLQAEKTKMQAIKEKLKLKIAKVNPG
jgi:hypothetical protein